MVTVVDAALVLRVSPARGNYILSAETPLNSKYFWFHLQWVTVDAAVFVLCVSPTSGNMQTLHSINSKITKHCLFHFQWVMAVDAVLVLCDLLFVSLSFNESWYVVDAVLILCVSPAWSISSNSLCGGNCQLKVISAPNDDVHSRNFWIQFRKRFPVVATMFNSHSHNQ